MDDFDESKYFTSADSDFSNAVYLCAAGLKFKDPEQGLDQTLADLLLQRAKNGETLTPNEMKKLAGLLSGHSIPFDCGTKKRFIPLESSWKLFEKLKNCREREKPMMTLLRQYRRKKVLNAARRQ